MGIVRYIVNDIDQALPFYQAIGFELTERWGPPFAMMARGDLSLWLSGPGSSASNALPDGSKPVSGGWNRLVIETDEIESIVEKLKIINVHFRSELISGPGGTQVVIEDPSGNPIELFQTRR